MSNGPILPADALSSALRLALPAIEAEVTTPKRARVTLTLPTAVHDDMSLTDRVSDEYTIRYDPHCPMMPLVRGDGLPRIGDGYEGPHPQHSGHRLQVVNLYPDIVEQGTARVSVVYGYVPIG